MNRHTRKLFKKAVIRLLALTIFSFTVVFVFSEVSFFYQKEPGDRAPEVIEMYIPEGTAQKVQAGEKITSIPDTMNFVVGDTLVIHNRDAVQHQLGPLYIPANSSASLTMDTPDSQGYACSFQQTKFMGMEVRTPTTLWTRMQGLLLAAPATAIFLFVYSLNVVPLEKKQKTEAVQK
jgi:hypothetical protein